MLILDSSALFSMENLPDEDFLCPPGVVDELNKYNDRRILLWGDLLKTCDCTIESIDIVSEIAKKSGDLGRLSPVDISVLALALDFNGTILSNDYSIQNVAAIMKMPFESIGNMNIKKIEKWNYRCNGCGKWYSEKSDECKICGHSMKSYRKKK